LGPGVNVHKTLPFLPPMAWHNKLKRLS